MNKKVQLNHRSSTPVRELTENLHLKFLASSEQSLSALKAIEDLLSSQQMYKCTSITHLLPSDCMAKHQFLDSSGLSFPSILLVYAPGSNVGNLHFLWKVPHDTQPSVCFELSQSAIEYAKKEIPVFHTRAMRAAMFRKFRVSSVIKPAVLRYFW